MTSLQEKCGKMRLYRGGLEAMETVSVTVSLVSSGFQSGKILRKSMHLMMLKGTLDTAVGIDWEKTMDKDTTWEMEDYRKMASMAQFMVELPETLVGTLHEELYNKTRVANEELGFSKTVKPAKLEEAAAQSQDP
jgi:hypothetical protein